MTDIEFKQIKDLCYKRSEGGLVSNNSRNFMTTKFGVVAQMNFRFQMFARLDNTLLCAYFCGIVVCHISS